MDSSLCHVNLTCCQLLLGFETTCVYDYYWALPYTTVDFVFVLWGAIQLEC